MELPLSSDGDKNPRLRVNLRGSSKARGSLRNGERGGERQQGQQGWGLTGQGPPRRSRQGRLRVAGGVNQIIEAVRGDKVKPQSQSPGQGQGEDWVR